MRRVHICIIIGLALGAGTILTDHHIHRLPAWTAFPLYTAAIACIIAGMLLTRAGR